MYTLRYPFKLPEGRSLSGQEFLGTCGTLQITLAPSEIYYVLDVKGFQDSVSAESFLPHVRAAMSWLLIERGLACEAASTLQPVQISDDPKEAAIRFRAGFGMEPVKDEELHGTLDASRPAVLLTDGTYRTLTAYPASVLMSRRIEDAGEVLIEGMSFPNVKSVLDDSRLETALDLFGAHYSEASSRAKLLTLVMVMEAIVEPKKRPSTVISLLNNFIKEVRERQKMSEPESPEAVAWEALEREFDVRGRDSIRSSISLLVSEVLRDEPPDAVERTARDARRIYDFRSKLVHGERVGQAEIDRALTDATGIVKKVLRAMFRNRVQENA